MRQLLPLYHLWMMLPVCFFWTVSSDVNRSDFKLQCDAAEMKIGTSKSGSTFLRRLCCGVL